MSTVVGPTPQHVLSITNRFPKQGVHDMTYHGEGIPWFFSIYGALVLFKAYFASTTSYLVKEAMLKARFAGFQTEKQQNGDSTVNMQSDPISVTTRGEITRRKTCTYDITKNTACVVVPPTFFPSEAEFLRHLDPELASKDLYMALTLPIDNDDCKYIVVDYLRGRFKADPAAMSPEEKDIFCQIMTTPYYELRGTENGGLRGMDMGARLAAIRTELYSRIMRIGSMISGISTDGAVSIAGPAGSMEDAGLKAARAFLLTKRPKAADATKIAGYYPLILHSRVKKADDHIPSAGGKNVKKLPGTLLHHLEDHEALHQDPRIAELEAELFHGLLTLYGQTSPFHATSEPMLNEGGIPLFSGVNY